MKKTKQVLLYALLSSFAFGVNAAEASFPDDGLIMPAIVGGIDATINELPWQAYIAVDHGADRYSSCGGTVIADTWILTAAHCLKKTDGSDVSAADISVYVGLANIARVRWGIGPDAKGANYRAVDQVFTHPQYVHSRQPIYNDIALIKLKSSITGTAAQPIKMIDQSDLSSFNGDYGRENNLVTSGWGYIDTTGQSHTDSLQRAPLKSVTDQLCSMSAGLQTIQMPSVLCAVGELPTTPGICQGDSGGPLIWQNGDVSSENDKGYRIVGVTSYTTSEYGSPVKCGNSSPDGFAEVAEFNQVGAFIIDTISSVDGNTNALTISPTFTVDIFDGAGDGGGGVIKPDPNPDHTYGGNASSFGIFGLLGLLALFGLRRYRY
ncbi:hypothetical protein VST7929_00690 [Vibrio stylophorae]|uniref:Peptidase S1 domain-containing protein n=1 Tax=Vibrio stylophorae TaxID=659351 RepID=A0ABN8DSN1_9VIBR|nr:serine protease [Vibrio stylophorae]CAH0532843.1 hypothetical protein VST7929_00690 [Vibrio stylophorae]